MALTAQYATIQQLRGRLPQSANLPDDVFEDALNNAEDIFDRALGFQFRGYTTERRAVPVYSTGNLLNLPPHQAGSVSSITLDSTALSPLTDWWEQEKFLYRPYGWYGDYTGRVFVLAAWGYGTYPEAATEAVLEIAVRIRRGITTGYASGVGSDGGGVAYDGKLPPTVKQIIEDMRREYRSDQQAI